VARSDDHWDCDGPHRYHAHAGPGRSMARSPETHGGLRRRARQIAVFEQRSSVSRPEHEQLIADVMTDLARLRAAEGAAPSDEQISNDH